MYVDALLPFGLHSAPRIFTALADALQWILQRRGVTLAWHYMTTLLYVVLPHHLSVTDLYRSSCEELGVPLAKHKVASLASCMTVLGIEIDTKAGQLCLPGDKQQRLKALLVS